MIRRIVVVWFVASILAVPAMAAPARWSLERASLGFAAKAAVFDQAGERTEAFLPDAYLSYSLTSQMSAAATVERDFANSLTIGRAGLRFLVYKSESSRAEVAAGGGIVGYGDAGAAHFDLPKPTSWDASLTAAYPVWISNRTDAVLAWGVVGARYDSQNALGTFTLGLRAQLIGGRP